MAHVRIFLDEGRIEIADNPDFTGILVKLDGLAILDTDKSEPRRMDLDDQEARQLVRGITMMDVNVSSEAFRGLFSQIFQGKGVAGQSGV